MVASVVLSVRCAASLSLPFPGNFNSSTVPFILASVARSYLGAVDCAIARDKAKTAIGEITRLFLNRRCKNMAPPADEPCHECNAALEMLTGVRLPVKDKTAKNRRYCTSDVVGGITKKS